MGKFHNVIESLRNAIPDKKGDRIKLFIAVPVLLACIGWIVYLVVSSIDLSGPTRIPDSPGFNIAHEVTLKLNEDLRFNDVGVTVVSEKPLKFRVVGAVRSNDAIKELKDFLQQVRPDLDYELDVLVLPH